MTANTPNPLNVVKKFLDTEKSLADFIQNGPAGGLGGWVRDGYRKRCDQFANLPGWARALGLGSAASLGRICQPYWDDGGFDGPGEQSAFNGGQCATTYSIPIWVRQLDGSEGLVTFLTATGPIQSITRTQVGTFTYRFDAVSANGAVSTTTQPNLSFGTEPRSGFYDPIGSPNDCGNPPGDLQPGDNPPPNPGPTSGPEPSDDPANPTGPPLLPIPPFDDPIGGPTPIEAPPDPPAPAPVPGNPESQPGGPENIAPAIPVDPGEGDDPQTDFGNPPEGAIWVGCLLKFTFPEEYGNIPGSGPENEVLPRTVGNASLVFNGGRGNAEIVRSAWQYLLRPSPALQVEGVFVNVSPGITYSVYPLSIESCPPNQCEA